jgi:hypothetical protein
MGSRERQGIEMTQRCPGSGKEQSNGTATGQGAQAEPSWPAAPARLDVEHDYEAEDDELAGGGWPWR